LKDVFKATSPNDFKAVLIAPDPYFNSTFENMDLNYWVKNGLLIYNMALTVRKDKPRSHSKIWSDFSQLLVKYLSNKRDINWKRC
jgi:uracil DNA glycosylase